MEQIQRACELTRMEKDLLVFDLLEPTILDFGASSKLSREMMRTQFDAAKERLERMNGELGEEYIEELRERIESLWEMRVHMIPNWTEGSPCT